MKLQPQTKWGCNLALHQNNEPPCPTELGDHLSNALVVNRDFPGELADIMRLMFQPIKYNAESGSLKTCISKDKNRITKLLVTGREAVLQVFKELFTVLGLKDSAGK